MPLQRSGLSFARLVDGIVNCSTPRRIAPERLAEIVRSGTFADDEVPQVAALFTEASLSTLVGFLREMKITAEQAARTYTRLRDGWAEQNPAVEDWLGYLGVAAEGGAGAA